VVALIVDATEPFGKGDQFVLDLLRDVAKGKRIAILNKIDQLKKNKLLPLMQRYGSLELFDEIIPVSALSGDGVDAFVDQLFAIIKPGEAMYPAED